MQKIPVTFPDLWFNMEESADKTVTLKEEVIMTWVNELLYESKPSTALPTGLAEWMCAGLLWVKLAPQSFQAFCQEQLKSNRQTQLQLSDLVLAGLIAQLADEASTFIDQTGHYHLLLSETLDPQETGLLQWKSLHPQISPAVQASWVWAADQLLKWPLPPAQVEQLIQLKEVYVYETDRQLWDKRKKTYRELPFDLEQEILSPANDALALLAWIPDQDEAEDMLGRYRKHAPPWQQPEMAAPEWLGPAAYLLYRGLNAYEMTQAAEELKKYTLRHLPLMPESTKKDGLLWLWQHYEQ